MTDPTHPAAAEPGQTGHTAPPPPTQSTQSTQSAHQAPAYPQHGMASDPRQKSPFLAGLLSFMPGLGQIYVGYYQRGFVHALVVALLIAMLAEDVGGLTPLLAIFLAFFWLYNVIDAARRAALYNQALAGIADVDLPDDWRTPGFRGSILGGLAITALGFLLLARTAWSISLEWVEEWWPLAIVAFGLYLVWKAIEDKRQRSATERDEIV